jgi:hypothetical protein
MYLIFKTGENCFNMIAYSMLVAFIYLNDSESRIINSSLVLVPAALACCLICFFIQGEETPCNETIDLLNKVISVLRLLVAIFVLLKMDSTIQWDWSTTFWPYWCSFAIQVIMGVASLIIFVNTVFNYLKDEAIIDDSKLILKLSI